VQTNCFLSKGAHCRFSARFAFSHFPGQRLCLSLTPPPPPLLFAPPTLCFYLTRRTRAQCIPCPAASATHLIWALLDPRLCYFPRNATANKAHRFCTCVCYWKISADGGEIVNKRSCLSQSVGGALFSEIDCFIYLFTSHFNKLGHYFQLQVCDAGNIDSASMVELPWHDLCTHALMRNKCSTKKIVQYSTSFVLKWDSK